MILNGTISGLEEGFLEHHGIFPTPNKSSQKGYLAYVYPLLLYQLLGEKGKIAFSKIYNPMIIKKVPVWNELIIRSYSEIFKTRPHLNPVICNYFAQEGENIPNKNYYQQIKLKKHFNTNLMFLEAILDGFASPQPPFGIFITHPNDWDLLNNVQNHLPSGIELTQVDLSTHFTPDEIIKEETDNG